MRRDPTLDNLEVGTARLSYLFRRMALVVDPEKGLLLNLALEFGWHETTLSRWIARGEMPRVKAQLLYKHFNKAIGFDVADLNPIDTTE